MKWLILMIVVTALAAGSVVWASTQDMYCSWGQDRWTGTNQMQMVGQPLMADQASRESQAYAACPYSSHQCSHWYGRLIPGHQANCHTSCSAGGYGCFRSQACR
jgi:hypothetical protein